MSTEMSTTLSRVCRWNCREGTVRMLESALGVWMTSWLVVPRPSPTVVRVYSNSCSSLPPSATKKKYPLMTPLWHHSEEIKYRTYNYGSVIHVLSRSMEWDESRYIQVNTVLFLCHSWITWNYITWFTEKSICPFFNFDVILDLLVFSQIIVVWWFDFGVIINRGCSLTSHLMCCEISQISN